MSANNTLYNYIPNLVYAEIFGILHSLFWTDLGKEKFLQLTIRLEA